MNERRAWTPRSIFASAVGVTLVLPNWMPNKGLLPKGKGLWRRVSGGALETGHVRLLGCAAGRTVPQSSADCRVASLRRAASACSSCRLQHFWGVREEALGMVVGAGCRRRAGALAAPEAGCGSAGECAGAAQSAIGFERAAGGGSRGCGSARAACHNGALHERVVGQRRQCASFCCGDQGVLALGRCAGVALVVL